MTKTSHTFRQSTLTAYNEVPLGRGLVALVSPDDLALVAGVNWTAATRGGVMYAKGTERGRRVYMHRVILNHPDSHVDHINGNGLDNRRENLRLATKSQNAANSRRKDAKFKGVFTQGAKWFAQIGHNGRTIYLGTFSSPEEAARAYDAKAVELFGEFAHPNFPVGVAA